MDVFIADVPGPHGKPFPPADQLENSLQFEFNVGAGHDFTSKPGGPDEVILAEVQAMVEPIQSTIRGHTNNHLLSMVGVVLVYQTLRLKTHTPALRRADFSCIKKVGVKGTPTCYTGLFTVWDHRCLLEFLLNDGIDAAQSSLPCIIDGIHEGKWC